ncbi:alpha/beta hydrolase fold domain-containing protein [Rhodococcus aetherivorans]
MASDDVVRAVKELNDSLDFGVKPSIDRIRAQVDAMWPEPSPDVQVEPATIGGVPGRWVTAPEPRNTVVIHLHGGGFANGSSVSHRDLAARISRVSGSRVFLPDFSLSPEHALGRALDEVVAVFRALTSGNIDPVFLSGDSAGGGLALSAALRLRDEAPCDGQRLPAGVIAMSPWADLTLDSESFRRNADIDPMGNPAAYASLARGYLQGHDARDPLASPCFADFTGFPPLLVQAGSSELIVDDAIRVAAAARRAGCEVDLQISYQMCHAFQLFGEFPETEHALEEVGRFVRRWATP